MDSVRIAIIEDEVGAKEHLISCINDFFNAEGMPFSMDCFATVDSFPLDIPYGLVFIDIVVFDKNGFELSKRIREKYGEETTAIVFVTSLVNYAIEGYSVGASAYIVKPYTYDAFCLRMRTVINRLRMSSDDRITLYTRDKQHVPVHLSSILYITSSGHYVTYHTESGDYELRQTVKECIATLQGKGFAQISNWCIVSLENIENVEGDAVTISGTKLSISRSRKKEFLMEFTKRYGI